MFSLCSAKKNEFCERGVSLGWDVSFLRLESKEKTGVGCFFSFGLVL